MSEANIYSLEAGCELWYVPNRGYDGKPRAVVLSKIGRKWANIESESRKRLDLVTLRMKSGDFDMGQCYTTRDEYERSTWLGQAWRTIRDNIDHRPPDNITPEQIEQIASILGLKLPAPLHTEGKG